MEEDKGNTCGLCKLGLVGKALTTLECGCRFHPHCLHSRFAFVYAICPLCKDKTDLSQLWDFGDDIEVDAAIREKHPNAVTVTYPSGDVKHSLWTSPNQTRKLLALGKPHSLLSMLLNYDGKTIRKQFGATAAHYSENTYTFDEFLTVKKGNRMDALRLLCDLSCTVDDLIAMDYCTETLEEEKFLKEEIHLLQSDLSTLRKFE